MIEFIVTAFVGAAKVVVEQLAGFFARSSAVSFTDGWWAGPGAQALLLTVTRVALMLMALFVVLAVIDGIIHSDTAATRAEAGSCSPMPWCENRFRWRGFASCGR